MYVTSITLLHRQFVTKADARNGYNIPGKSILPRRKFNLACLQEHQVKIGYIMSHDIMFT